MMFYRVRHAVLLLIFLSVLPVFFASIAVAGPTNELVEDTVGNQEEPCNSVDDWHDTEEERSCSCPGDALGTKSGTQAKKECVNSCGMASCTAGEIQYTACACGSVSQTDDEVSPGQNGQGGQGKQGQGQGAGQGNPATYTVGLRNPLKYKSFQAFLPKLVDGVTIVLMPIIVLAIVYIGFRMVWAGREQKSDYGKWKQAFVMALVGLFLILGARGILYVIRNTIGDVLGPEYASEITP